MSELYKSILKQNFVNKKKIEEDDISIFDNNIDSDSDSDNDSDSNNESDDIDSNCIDSIFSRSIYSNSVDDNNNNNLNIYNKLCTLFNNIYMLIKPLSMKIINNIKYFFNIIVKYIFIFRRNKFF